MGSLTDEDIERLRKLAPDIVAKLEAPPEEDEEEPIVFVDQPVLPLVTESGEARDQDTVLPADVCPACLRGGPRRGAPHTCGLPSPQFIPRQEHG
jgi:hypothetical protein